MSHASPSESQTESSRELPMRAEPMMWKAPSVTCAASQPQESAASSIDSRPPSLPGS